MKLKCARWTDENTHTHTYVRDWWYTKSFESAVKCKIPNFIRHVHVWAPFPWLTSFPIIVYLFVSGKYLVQHFDIRSHQFYEHFETKYMICARAEMDGEREEALPLFQSNTIWNWEEWEWERMRKNEEERWRTRKIEKERERMEKNEIEQKGRKRTEKNGRERERTKKSQME